MFSRRFASFARRRSGAGRRRRVYPAPRGFAPLNPVWYFLLIVAAHGAEPYAAVAQQDPAPGDTAVASLAATDSIAVPSRSPRGAFLRSLAVPGWGQVWVGAPTRGALYFTLAAGSGAMLFKSRRGLNEARESEEELRESGEPEDPLVTGLVEAREQQVEDWTALTIFLFFFSAADAYVAAHLADIDDYAGVEPRDDGALELRVSVPWPRRQ